MRYAVLIMACVACGGRVPVARFLPADAGSVGLELPSLDGGACIPNEYLQETIDSLSEELSQEIESLAACEEKVEDLRNSCHLDHGKHNGRNHRQEH